MTSRPTPKASSPAAPPRRARYLDITKGLAILCIVLLHFSAGLIPPLLNVYIGTFMITTFYVTAGWVDSFRPQTSSFRERVGRLWKQLGVPYVVWTVVILLFDVLFWTIGHYNAFIIARDIYKSLVLRGIGTLWFLPALFGGQCLWWWIRHFHRWWVIPLSVVLLFLLGFLLGPLVPSGSGHRADIIRAPWLAFFAMVNAYVGIVCGFIYGRFSSRISLPDAPKWMLIPAGCLILALGWYFTFHNPFPMSLWQWLAPNIIPAGFIVLFMALETSPLLRYFSYWGRNSMALMVTHFSILLVLADIICRWLTGHRVAGAGWVSFGAFCALMAVEYFIAEWLRRRFPRSIGHSARHPRSSDLSATRNAKHS